MSPKLDEAGADALKGLMEFAKSAKEFTLEQAPLLAKEVVAFGRVWWTFMSVVGLVGACVLLMSFYYTQKYSALYTNTRAPEDYKYQSIGNFWLALGFVGGIALVVSVASAAPYHAVLAWFAPRVYIIGQLAEVVK